MLSEFSRNNLISRIGTSAGRPQTSMGRPGTAAARAAPPKLKKKQIAQFEEKPQVPSNEHHFLCDFKFQIQEPTTEIFVESDKTEEDNEQFLIEETPEVSKAVEIEIDVCFEIVKAIVVFTIFYRKTKNTAVSFQK